MILLLPIMEGPSPRMIDAPRKVKGRERREKEKRRKGEKRKEETEKVIGKRGE